MTTLQCIALCDRIAQTRGMTPQMVHVSTLSVATSRGTEQFWSSRETDLSVVALPEESLTDINASLDSLIGSNLVGAYAATKYLAEMLCSEAHQSGKLPALLVRVAP